MYNIAKMSYIVNNVVNEVLFSNVTLDKCDTLFTKMIFSGITLFITVTSQA